MATTAAAYGTAAVLAVAAGATFGLTAALMKGMTNAYARGFGALFTSWQLYGMVAADALGLFLVQSALNAGRVIAAQPGLTLSDPVVSILWGVFVYGEQARGGWFISLAVVSGLVMAAAVVTLARSPLLSGQAAQPEEERPVQGRNEQEEAESRDRFRADASGFSGDSDSQDVSSLKKPVRGTPGGGEC